jgi:hypothetical protein
LHYIYTGGDVTELDPIYADNIEIKVLTGNSALRRKLSFCNDIPIANINSGLPKRKKGDKVVNFENVKNEKMLRALIKKNLNKEIHAYTKPSIDFIEKLLSDAYASGFKYDVSDMRQAIQYFAQSSTNQAPACLKACMRMKYKSKHYENDVAGDYISLDATESKDDELVFYDIEVFPNLLVINWKVHGDDKPVNRMINPSPAEVEQFLKHKLVGFNCRRYDNHIVYARMMGYTNEQLFRLSQRIINGDKDAFFGEAYNLSYTDIYDFLSSGNKMSLKKWEIKLGIHHHELGLPWDKPVPEELWETVAEYCDDDVLATEALWNSKPCQADWEARVVLARIAGGTVNDTTNSLTTRLIFEGNKHPQNEFVYTDLSKEFPGYKFENGVSSYRDVEEVGEGGYVYSNPGIYHNVITFDVASMHPHSVIALNLFGDRYTQKFKELVEARIAVKHRDTETLKVIFNGAFAEFINASDSELKNLANALKTAINSVYGLTSAKFPNAFRDPRNIDNIVAKRGALFMINLRNEVEKRGGTVVHIKTDSIKIENPSPELQQFVMDYGKQYGYSFEIEHIFEKICLVNKAVYIAKLASDDPDHPGEWTATGTQFAVPYVFKTLFSKEDICFEDLCETKEVKGSMSIDLVEDLNGQEHNLKFVGKVGSFCPMLPGYGGGILVRDNNGKYDAVTGTKGYLWMESELVKNLDKQDGIDMSYYDKLVDDAFVTIAEYGDANKFINE